MDCSGDAFAAAIGCLSHLNADEQNFGECILSQKRSVLNKTSATAPISDSRPTQASSSTTTVVKPFGFFTFTACT